MGGKRFQFYRDVGPVEDLPPRKSSPQPSLSNVTTTSRTSSISTPGTSFTSPSKVAKASPSSCAFEPPSAWCADYSGDLALGARPLPHTLLHDDHGEIGGPSRGSVPSISRETDQTLCSKAPREHLKPDRNYTKTEGDAKFFGDQGLETSWQLMKATAVPPRDTRSLRSLSEIGVVGERDWRGKAQCDDFEYVEGCPWFNSQGSLQLVAFDLKARDSPWFENSARSLRLESFASEMNEPVSYIGLDSLPSMGYSNELKGCIPMPRITSAMRSQETRGSEKQNRIHLKLLKLLKRWRRSRGSMFPAENEREAQQEFM